MKEFARERKERWKGVKIKDISGSPKDTQFVLILVLRRNPHNGLSKELSPVGYFDMSKHCRIACNVACLRVLCRSYWI